MDRVYVILDITEGKYGEAVQSLRANPGVQWVDTLEGQWDLIMAIEASNRLRLAKFLVRALASVETITEDLQLLVTGNGSTVQRSTHSVGKAAMTEAIASKSTRRNHDRLNILGSV